MGYNEFMDELSEVGAARVSGERAAWFAERDRAWAGLAEAARRLVEAYGDDGATDAAVESLVAALAESPANGGADAP